MALTLITAKWAGQWWYGVFMSLCFQYEGIPAEEADFSSASLSQVVTEQPPVWTMVSFRFRKNHAYGYSFPILIAGTLRYPTT